MTDDPVTQTYISADGHAIYRSCVSPKADTDNPLILVRESDDGSMPILDFIDATTKKHKFKGQTLMANVANTFTFSTIYDSTAFLAFECHMTDCMMLVHCTKNE